MDIVSSFSRHSGAKAEAASRVLVFGVMGCAAASSTEDVVSNVRRRHGDARSPSPSPYLLPIAPNLGSRWREHKTSLPLSLARRQSKSAFLSKTAMHLNVLEIAGA
jgi:hypothetical protein